MKKSGGLDALVRAGLSPRALTRAQAAAYVSLSIGAFNTLVERGQMPRPRRIGATRLAWDRLELDSYFSRLPHDDGTAPESPEATGAEDIWDRAAL
jgi:predicted DNA-binding transcriptional regulator AlpA